MKVKVRSGTGVRLLMSDCENVRKLLELVNDGVMSSSEQLTPYIIPYARDISQPMQGN